MIELFAKVDWGKGKGPYILGFKTQADYTVCSANSHNFKPLKEKDVKGKIPIWEFGSKTPEQIASLKVVEI